MRTKMWKIYCRRGFEEAQELELGRIENWTPLLVYIHSSRLIIGAILGLVAGIAMGIFIGIGAF